MLTRTRVVVSAVTASASLACLTAMAPSAMARPGVPVARAAVTRTAGGISPRFGPAAAAQVVKDLLAAWQITKGDGVTVAVVGGGVDGSVPGLAGRVTNGPSFGNVRHDTLITDTIVAAAVAATGPSTVNPSATVGLAPAATILAIRVDESAADQRWQRYEAEAIRYAVDHHAQVIFIDLVGFTDTTTLESAVQYAVSRNAVVISEEYGSGPSRNATEFPTSLPGVMGAGSVVLSGFPRPSQHYPTPVNDSILVAAPGNVSVEPGPAGQNYELSNGLAAAAWLVATVALMKSVYPHLTPGLAARALAVSARDHPRHGYNTTIGFGLINPVGALREASTLLKLPVVAAAGPGAVRPSARFVSGPTAGVIMAVHHSTVKLAGFSGLIAIGLVLMITAVLLSRRSRRIRRRLPAGPRT